MTMLRKLWGVISVLVGVAIVLGWTVAFIWAFIPDVQ